MSPKPRDLSLFICLQTEEKKYYSVITKELIMSLQSIINHHRSCIWFHSGGLSCLRCNSDSNCKVCRGWPCKSRELWRPAVFAETPGPSRYCLVFSALSDDTDMAMSEEGRNVNWRCPTVRRVLRKTFGPERDDVTREWRRLHNVELHAVFIQGVPGGMDKTSGERSLC